VGINESSFKNDEKKLPVYFGLNEKELKAIPVIIYIRLHFHLG